MAAALSDEAWLAAMLHFEAALAQAEADLGVVSAAAAEAVVRACRVGRYDVAELGRAAIGSANPVVPLIEAIQRNGGAEAHHGATSQDTLDTAMMLVAREGLDLLLADLERLAGMCAGLAESHRGTVMAGRTLLQQAVPVTFGLKAAGWLGGVGAAADRLREVRKSRLAVQLGGAAGTLAALGERGPAVAAGLAMRLGLPVPPMPWHSERSRIAEIGAALWMAGGAAAKIAQDLVLLAQTEVGEVAEARPGGSSTMPHKQNPVASIEALSALRLLEGPVNVLMRSMTGEHERAAGSWQAEWPALTEAFLVAAGVVRRTNDALDGLQVDAERMLRNIDQATIAPATDARDQLGATDTIIDAALAAWKRREIK
jgi:3-carboxy-cis,cis-muconate cycloisomerase